MPGGSCRLQVPKPHRQACSGTLCTMYIPIGSSHRILEGRDPTPSLVCLQRVSGYQFKCHTQLNPRTRTRNSLSLREQTRWLHGTVVSVYPVYPHSSSSKARCCTCSSAGSGARAKATLKCYQLDPAASLTTCAYTFPPCSSCEFQGSKVVWATAAHQIRYACSRYLPYPYTDYRHSTHARILSSILSPNTSCTCLLDRTSPHGLSLILERLAT